MRLGDLGQPRTDASEPPNFLNGKWSRATRNESRGSQLAAAPPGVRLVLVEHFILRRFAPCSTSELMSPNDITSRTYGTNPHDVEVAEENVTRLGSPRGWSAGAWRRNRAPLDMSSRGPASRGLVPLFVCRRASCSRRRRSSRSAAPGRSNETPDRNSVFCVKKAVMRVRHPEQDLLHLLPLRDMERVLRITVVSASKTLCPRPGRRGDVGRCSARNPTTSSTRDGTPRLFKSRRSRRRPRTPWPSGRRSSIGAEDAGNRSRSRAHSEARVGVLQVLRTVLGASQRLCPHLGIRIVTAAQARTPARRCQLLDCATSGAQYDRAPPEQRQRPRNRPSLRAWPDAARARRGPPSTAPVKSRPAARSKWKICVRSGFERTLRSRRLRRRTVASTRCRSATA